MHVHTIILYCASIAVFLWCVFSYECDLHEMAFVPSVIIISWLSSTVQPAEVCRSLWLIVLDCVERSLVFVSDQCWHIIYKILQADPKLAQFLLYYLNKVSFLWQYKFPNQFTVCIVCNSNRPIFNISRFQFNWAWSMQMII